MFRALANVLGSGVVLSQNPQRLNWWLEEAWVAAGLTPIFGTSGGTPGDVYGNASIIGALGPAPTLPPAPAGSGLPFPGLPFPGGNPLLFDHLVYAYLIESTGVFEIMAEVVRRVAVGETLDELSIPSHQWVRSTEELFLSYPSMFTLSGLGSFVRQDIRQLRRNAYWRMFGLDLPHKLTSRSNGDGSGGQPWKTDIGTGANSGFRQNWFELLRQVWLGLENRKNSSGTNATDDEYIASLCRALGDMLRMRRRGGQLTREEFVAVSTMHWFHLTLETNSSIVSDLNAQATSPAERLNKIGQRVGMAPAVRSRELFELAEPMSQILRSIELHFFDSGSGARSLYVDPAPNPVLQQEINRIIDLWQSTTGERVKDPAVRVATMSGASQPLRLPTPTTPVPVATGNGRTG